MTLRSHNRMTEEIKSDVTQGNSCHHSLLDIFFLESDVQEQSSKHMRYSLFWALYHRREKIYVKI
jgi:hypothetical protein